MAIMKARLPIPCFFKKSEGLAIESFCYTLGLAPKTDQWCHFGLFQWLSCINGEESGGQCNVFLKESKSICWNR